jgi:solute carrier family 25 S-adenosylmethionine transporter 26
MTSRAPFATISLAGFGAPGRGTPQNTPEKTAAGSATDLPGKAVSRRPVPHFMVASAAGDAQLTAAGVPAWRGVLANLLAGAMAGCAVEAALYPIDTIKTRMQMARTGGGVRALFKSGGGKALYAGLVGNLLGVAPATAVFMAVYEPIKQEVAKRVPDNRSFLGPLTAGAASGLAASLIRVPTEVVKQRMQSGEFVGAIQAVKSICAREGVRGMFAGYGSFLLRDLPFDAIEFVTYEQLRRAYKVSLAGSREVSGAETAVMGAAAGAVTGILTTPFDVLKTRLMTQGANRTYANVGDCAVKIWQEEGWRTFFKGWEPRVLWISIGGCVFFSALEVSKQKWREVLGVPTPPGESMH